MRKFAIPLWIPVAVLALAICAVGWLRRSQPQPPEPSRSSSAGAATSTAAPVAPKAAVEDQQSQSPVATVAAHEPVPAPRSPVVLVHGRIHDANGSTLPHAWVRWTDVRGREASVNQSNGEYLAAGLEPGRWTASVVVGGGAQSAETIELAAEPALVQHDILVETHPTVPVFLTTATGEELHAALRTAKADMLVLIRLSLVATRENPPAHLPPSGLNQLPGNGCGEFMPRQGFNAKDLPEGCCGTFEFRAPAPLWIHVVLGSAPVASQRIESIPERLELEVDLDALLHACGSVRLRVIDAQSQTVLPDAEAMLGTLQMAGRMLKLEGDVLAMHGLAPGAYSLTVRASGRGHDRREFVMRAGEDLDLGDIPLSIPHPFALHFTDRDGKPLSVQFHLERLVPGDARATMGLFTNESYRSEPDGMADLKGLSPGRWVVRVDRQATGNGPGTEEPSLCTRPVVLDTSDLAASEATIVLEPVGELVLLPRSANARGMRFYLDTPDSLPVRAGRIYSGSPLRIGLAPGPYGLTLEDQDGAEVFRRSVEIGPKPVEIDVPR